jgi:predicted CopG family antitoxin
MAAAFRVSFILCLSKHHVEKDDALVHADHMSKTITIDDDVYKLLLSLKRGPRDYFTKVIRRHFHNPLDDSGEFLGAYNQLAPPNVNLEVLDRILKERGRRSGGRK